MSVEHRWNDTEKEGRKYSVKKYIPLLYWPPQIPHGMSSTEIYTTSMSHKCDCTSGLPTWN